MAADQRVFTLIGNFTDNITPALESINGSITKLKNNIDGLSKLLGPLKGDFRELASLSRDFGASLKDQAADLREMTGAMKAYRGEMGRLNRAYRAGGNRVVGAAAKAQERAARASAPRITYSGGGGKSGGGGGGGGGGGNRKEYFVGDVISGSLLSQAIVGGFQQGVNLLQQGLSKGFDAFAERSKDQLEDIAAAGGIFSAGKFAKVPDFPKTFQEAMQMQDNINKQMAAIASNLPGTTHDYVENSRRLVDTTAQIMAKDFQNFTNLAKELSGKLNVTAPEAFEIVNVEVAKATTMLEKMNPAKTVIPMTQIVEDMLKSEQVSIGGLRKYVAFKRGTTFEAALTRNLKEVNEAGAGTAARLKAIIKVLKEAVPSEMVVAFQRSVDGVIEGFKSAFFDPDVGLFGLSRTLSFEVQKFDQQTGKLIGTEYSNFFKIFGETFGNIGNLLNNAILPGLGAIYEPFAGMAKSILKLREWSYKIYERQQQYTKYYEGLAADYGMSKEGFQVFQKGGVSTLLDVLLGFGAIDKKIVPRINAEMKKSGSEEEIANRMRGIYQEIIPAVFKSPFFKNLMGNLGTLLAEVFKQIAIILKALITQDYGQSEFMQAFQSAKGLDAINEIIIYVAEGLGKIILSLAQIYMSALGKALTSGNFAAAGVLGGVGLLGANALGLGGLLGVLGGGKGGKGGNGGLLGALFGPRTAMRNARAPYAQGFGLLGAFGKDAASAGAKGAAGRLGAIGGAARFIPGGALAMGAVGAGLGIASGEPVGRALAGGFMSVLLGSAGSFFGPAGTIIGGIAGQSLGEAIYDKFTPAGMAQAEAARIQKEAADRQLAAADRQSLKDKYNLPEMEFSGFQTAELAARAKALGYTGPLVDAMVKEYGERNRAYEVLKEANKKLVDMETYLSTQVDLPEKDKEALLKPLRDATIAARTKLITEQGQLMTALKPLPEKFISAVATNAKNISFVKVQQIIEDGAAKAMLRATANAYRVPTPQGKIKAPNGKPYQGPGLPEDDGSGWKRTSKGSGWKRTSIGEGDCLSSMGMKGLGSVNAATPLASRYGLTMTSGYRPGSLGWHGVDRARDYSNGYGPTPQMMAFARFMASNYGGSLKELIYTPLGYSIKNGRKVPPYATAGHYNHVHVAAAWGLNNAVGFGRLADARSFENAMKPGGAKVKTITANSSEGLGGTAVLNNSITINAQPGQSTEAIAQAVMDHMNMWWEQANAATILV